MNVCRVTLTRCLCVNDSCQHPAISNKKEIFLFESSNTLFRPNHLYMAIYIEMMVKPFHRWRWSEKEEKKKIWTEQRPTIFRHLKSIRNILFHIVQMIGPFLYWSVCVCMCLAQIEWHYKKQNRQHWFWSGKNKESILQPAYIKIQPPQQQKTKKRENGKKKRICLDLTN